MAKLDKSKPFGEVSGAMACGTRYFQNDKRFDANGDEVAEPVASTGDESAPADTVVPADQKATPVKGKPGPKPAAKTAAKTADTVVPADQPLDEQLAAQLAEQPKAD